MCSYCGLVFLFGTLCGLLFGIFADLIKAYFERVKRKRELEEKALKALSLIVGGKKDEK